MWDWGVETWLQPHLVASHPAPSCRGAPRVRGAQGARRGAAARPGMGLTL